MKNMSGTKKRVLAIVIMTIVGAIFTLAYLIVNGNANQVYNDIVVESTSIFSSNKSVERNLIFILCFLGIAIYSIVYLCTNKRMDADSTESGLLENQKAKEFLCALSAIAIVGFIVLGATGQILFIALMFAVILYSKDKELVVPGICVYFLSVYTYIAMYRMYVFVGGQHSGENVQAVLVALVLSSFPLFLTNKKTAFLRLGLIESIIIPFALLIFLANKYKNGEDILTINTSTAITVTIWIIVIVFSGRALFIAVKKWKHIDSIEDVIRMGSCVTIMTFNRFDGTGAIMPKDLHHPFENIIGYSQVVDLGRIPFKDYIPVSGMYSIVQGAIYDWFGDGGTFANYHVTNNFFYLLVIIGLIGILKKHLDNMYVLLVSLIFLVQTYNRLVFILPIMLLLIWPRLLEKKNTWLMIWFMTSLFQGLYYPLYGAATCIAFFPMVIWQIITYVKSGELKKDSKTIKFWFGWCVCFVVTLLCTGFLMGTLKHMLAMSSQSILADGISRFGQLVPSEFFSYLGDENSFIRLSLYYVFTFVIPPLFVWVAYAISIKTAKISIENKKLKIKEKRNFYIMISAVIMPVVCYTFTVIRLDIGSIYARSASVLLTGMVLVLVFTWNYIENGKLRLIIIIFVTAIPAVVNVVSVFETESNSKLQAYYTVPENYIYVEDDPVEKMGTGFIKQDIYNTIVDTNNRFARKDKEQSYCGDPSVFGYYYLLDLKGDGAMEIALTVKSFSAAQEAADIAREKKSIVGPLFTPFYNYYFYHWLLDSGEYYWDAEAWEFIPNDGRYTREEILEQNKNNEIASCNIDIGKTASSWGLSINSLEKLFTEKTVSYCMRQDGNGTAIDFEQAFDGEEADFLYLEFTNMATNNNYVLYNLSGEVEQEEYKYAKYLMRKNYNPGMTVQVWWQDENGEAHAMICKMSQGKLLLPIGAGTKWLFNDHNYISVHVFQDDVEIVTPEISNIRFLKIQEVE